MTNEQWNLLVDVVNRKHIGLAPVGFIIDSPWLPGWAVISTLDYYVSGKLRFEANKKAIDTFPDTIFLPGWRGKLTWKLDIRYWIL